MSPILQNLRDNLIQHQNGLCYYCRRRMTPPGTKEPRSATLEHLAPKSLGGLRGNTNLVAACLTCNQAKGDLTPEQFFEVLAAYNQEEARQ